MSLWLFALMTFIVLSVTGSISGSISLNYTVSEEVKIGTIIGHIIKDAKIERAVSGTNNCQLFDLTSHNQSKGVLQISQTCDLLVNSRIDREQLCESSKCILQMSAYIDAKYWVTVFIEIIDINDNSPRFETVSTVVRFEENSNIGFSQNLPLATDNDIGQNSVHSYTLQPLLELFELVYTPPRALRLVLRGNIDYEKKSQRMFSTNVVACDDGSPQLCGKLILNLQVVDMNDNRPIFIKCNESITVMEDSQIGRTVYQVFAQDFDDGENGRVSYEINSIPDNKLSLQYFSVNQATGNVFLIKSLHSVGIPDKFFLIITARDHGTIALSSECKLTLDVIDINNHAPSVIVTPTIGNYCQITENHNGISTVALVMVTDGDKGNNGKVSCELSNTISFVILERWSTESSTFKLMINRPVDRELMSSINVSIVCRDHGTQPKTTRQYLSISIIDVNEYQPVINVEPNQIIIPEDLQLNSSVGLIRATDRDPDAKLSVSLRSDHDGYFLIDSLGNLRLKKSLDREMRPFHHVVLLVSDNSPPTLRTASLTLTITVSDVNDNIPKLVEPSAFHLLENVMKSGSTIGQLKAIDPDLGLNGSVKFKLIKANSLDDKLINNSFSISENDGTIYSLLPIDREITSEIILQVSLMDQGSPSLNKEEIVRITIADENDNKPVWMFPSPDNCNLNFSVLPSTSRYSDKHVIITNVRVFDPDSPENANITFKLLSATKDKSPVHLFTLDTLSGHLMGNAPITEGIYILTMQASDNGNPPLHSDVASLYITAYSSNSGFFFNSETDRLSLTLIVALASVTCIICISLLVAIIVVRRHRYSAIQYSVNGHANDHNSLVNDSLTKWTEEQNQYIDSWNYPPHYCSYPVIPGFQKISSIGEPLLPPPGPKDVLSNMNNSAHMCPIMHLRRPTNQDIDVSSADSGRGASEEENALNEAKNRESLRARGKMYPTMPPISSVCACQDSMSMCNSCTNGVGSQYHYQYVTYSPTSYPNYDDTQSIQFHTSRPQIEQTTRNYHTLDTIVTATSMGSYTDVIPMESDIQQHLPKDMSSFLGPHSNV